MLKCVAVGTIVRDADLVAVNGHNGIPINRSRFTVVVGRNVSPTGDPYYVDCTLWDKTAASLAPWLKKGTKVTVTGDFYIASYMKNDGKLQSNIQVKNPAVELMGRNEGAAAEANKETPVPVSQSEVDEPLAVSEETFSLPF